MTSDAAVAQRCRVMRLHGIDRDAFSRFTDNSAGWRYDVVAPGFKYNLPDLAAALGRQQLKHADQNREKRAKIAERYSREFSDLPARLPPDGAPDLHSWHLYVLRLPGNCGVTRQALEDVIAARGIGYSMHYTPLHRFTYWRELSGLTDADLPVASEHGDTAISLPIFPAMRAEEVSQVIAAVRHAFDVAGSR